MNSTIMQRRDGKLLRVGGDPNIEKDWELCTYKNVKDCIRHYHKLPEKLSPKIAQQIFEALQYSEIDSDVVSLDEYMNFTRNTQTDMSTNIADKVLRKVSQLIDDGHYQHYVKHMRKFNSRGFINQQLVSLQDKMANFVGSEKDWLESGRKPKNDAKPMYILGLSGIKKVWDEKNTEPIDYRFNSKEELASFIAKWESRGYVVNANSSKLEARVIHNPVNKVGKPSGQPPADLISFLQRQTSSLNVSIEYYEEHTQHNGRIQKGHGDNDASITIRKDLPEAEKARTLVHEFMHYHLGHAERNSTSRRQEIDREIAAEMLTLMVSKRFGFDIDEYSSHYIAEWSQGDKKRVERITREDVVPMFQKIMSEFDKD